jgi:hypothetical protein
MTNYCRITAVLKVETDIIAIIAMSPVGQVVIMYVEIFTTDVIVLSVLNVMKCDVSLTAIFQYQSLSSLILTISHSEIKGRMSYADNYIYELAKTREILTGQHYETCRKK